MKVRAHAALFTLCASAVFVPGHFLAASVPSYDEVRAKFRPSELYILDRYGDVLQEMRTDARGRRLAWARLPDISPALVRAVIKGEDKDFASHSGVDYTALAAGFFQTVFSGYRRGGSTIPMQLGALLDPELRARRGGRTVSQKVAQIRRGKALHGAWTKDQILEAYLNLVSFRGELSGVSAASRGLFGKTPGGLNFQESLILAALIRAPRADSSLVARRACDLGAQLEPGFAGCAELRALTRRALERPAERVASFQGIAFHAANEAVKRSGTIRSSYIRTTLDRGTQNFAAEALRNQISRVHHRNVRDGAVLVVDNETGEVRAYVGSSGDFSLTPFVDMVQARRQAGSILKPFLYGLALDRRRITAATILVDEPLNLPVVRGLYDPQNYDGNFRGEVSARLALASSLNLPAVRVIAMTGEDAMVETMERLGFGELRTGDFYGPSLALGSPDVTLWELVQAFRTLARRGRFSELHLLSDPRRRPHPGVPVFSPEAAFIVSDILSDRDARSLTFGLESALSTRAGASVKTGTSKDMRDNWCIGYTEAYTVGVWTGNASGESMYNVLGVTGAAPVWVAVVSYLHDDIPRRKIGPPSGLVRAEINFHNGEGKRSEWFISGTEPAGTKTAQIESPARITYPLDGTILARDMDTPSTRQRVFFRTESENPGLVWRLDGRIIGHGPLVAWEPLRGGHVLTLEEGTGGRLDEIRFEVR